ncbi:hypothetical protein RclHR1_29120002 [Rhizophagus clarus]|uniref:Uncharacterized protein n=1 Tax=Rhizophagus clarus TaxID=94130 RepID=A0A2Z6R483_9GLOM|nr:hypothetical protein RclHR1_29120002 [Rhizophagus clarus]GES97519.1 hypothetical protein RCL_jg8691.t1 [Rhizophagus clarus]
MNHEESSSRKNKRPVSNKNNENEEIVVSSDGEQITQNNKKLKLSTTQKTQNLFQKSGNIMKKVYKRVMDIMKLFVSIARQNGQEENHKKWKHTW